MPFFFFPYYWRHFGKIICPVSGAFRYLTDLLLLYLSFLWCDLPTCLQPVFPLFYMPQWRPFLYQKPGGYDENSEYLTQLKTLRAIFILLFGTHLYVYTLSCFQVPIEGGLSVWELSHQNQWACLMNSLCLYHWKFQSFLLCVFGVHTLVGSTV